MTIAYAYPRVRDGFGANRCMFESNFPVDKGECSYQVLFNAFKRLATGTASRFHRLGK